MVRAILDGRKTTTRRVAIPRYDDRTPCEHWQGDNSGMGATMFRHCCHGSEGRGCPHGVVGDRLWVRETWNIHRIDSRYDGERYVYQDAHIGYVADNSTSIIHRDHPSKLARAIKGNRPSIFMPRWASRITLEIVSVKVERVQEISEEDAKAEGVEQQIAHGNPLGWKNYLWHGDFGSYGMGNKTSDSWPYQFSTYDSAVGCFSSLWHLINAKRGYGWGVNPWVWAITFKRVK
jgi:hypothetical protein